MHPAAAILGSLEAEQGLMHSNCFHRSGREKAKKENSSGTWWKGDGKGAEYCCFSSPIKLFVKPFTKGYAVYLFKINTLVSVWKLVPTQDRSINYSVLCAIAELLKVEPYLFLFQINNYLLPCSSLPLRKRCAFYSMPVESPSFSLCVATSEKCRMNRAFFLITKH